MNVAGLERAELVRVTVAAGGRKVDLALPARIPVAELVPEIVSAVGSLDPYDVYAGYTVVTAEGVVLDGDDTLMAQQVHDGALLSVVAGVDRAAPKVYDDVIEAVADAVEQVGGAWSERASRATVLWVSGLALALGAATLVMQTSVSDDLRGILAASAAVVLVLSGAVFALLRKDTASAAVASSAAAVYAVVASYALVDGPLLGRPLLVAAVAVAAIGTVGLFVLGRQMWAAVPPVLLGVVAAACSAVLSASELDPAKVVLVPMVLAVVAAAAVPLWSLSATRTTTAPIRSESEILADPEPIEFDRVSRGVELASYLAVGLSLGLSMLIAATSVLVVRLGVTGFAICLAAALLQVLNTRRYLLSRDVVVGIAGGLASGTAAVLAALAFQPTWRPGLAVMLAATAAVLLVALALPPAPRVAWERFVDVVEVVLLVAILPLTLVALNALALVR